MEKNAFRIVGAAIVTMLLIVGLSSAVPIQETRKDFMDERGPYEGGDMILTEEQKMMMKNNGINSGIIGDHYRWLNGHVIVRIDPAFTNTERGQIYRAMGEIQGKTCIRFYTKDDTTRDWVFIKRGRVNSGCYSNVGKTRQGGEQELNLEPGCTTSVGVIVHELVHAIGFFHEQSRTDRDDWVRVNWGNIQDGRERNFEKYDAQTVNPEGRDYDYKSIMHYSGYAFAKNGKIATLIPTKPGWKPEDLGQRDGLTPWDADKINNMYRTWCT